MEGIFATFPPRPLDSDPLPLVFTFHFLASSFPSTLYFLKYFEVYLYLVLIFSLSLYLPSTFFSSLLSFSHFLLVSVDFFPHASIFMFMVITTQ